MTQLHINCHAVDSQQTTSIAVAVLEAAVQDTVLHSDMCCRNVVLQAVVVDVDHACKRISSLTLLACCMQTVQLFVARKLLYLTPCCSQVGHCCK